MPGTFTLDFNLNALPPEKVYLAYDWEVDVHGVDIVPNSLVQTVWPECGPPPRPPGMPASRASCAVNTGHGSTYTGVLLHVDVRCPVAPSNASITLLNSVGHTDLIDGAFVPHIEGRNETLAIVCPGAVTDTPTSTPTQTDTPTPTRTPTPTPTPTPAFPAGDAGCHGTTDAIDALLVLQYSAGYPPSWCTKFGDANRDGVVNTIDAMLILQYVAGLIAHLPV